ncbi:3-oxoacyl-[acyl-carrier-protein] synthase 3 [Clostridia bacterium]|nr:3-oxoacyl-[acyl-carrier-protein] synthase 3 [Clostridia bacterium]
MRILGTGSCLPKRIVTNDDLATFLETSDEWIFSRTGIKERRVLSDEKFEDMAAGAALEALADAKVDVSEIDYILCSNTIGEYMTPGLGCFVQKVIGATCPALDVNGACSGFVFALQIANALLISEYKKILVICAEESSRLCDWSDRSTCVLFGDGAGAVVVEKSGDDPIFRVNTASHTDILYSRYEPGNSPFVQEHQPKHYLHMSGQEVYKLAVSTMCSDINDVLDRSNLQPTDVKYYILHQANLRIINTIISRMNLPAEYFPHNIEKYGNTSSASIPILLDEINKRGGLKRGEKVVFSAFGAGITSGSCAMTW